VEVNRTGREPAARQSRVEIAGLQLKLLAGMAPDAPLALKEMALAPLPLDVDARSARDRPDRLRRAGEKRVAAATSERAGGGPVGATINLGYQRRLLPAERPRRAAPSGRSRTPPLLRRRREQRSFGQNRNEGNVAATAATRAAERRVEFAVLTAQQEVGAAFTQYEAARRSLDIYERGVRDVSRRNLDVIRQAYQLGRGSLLDVIAEQRRFIEVENGYTDVLKQVYDAAIGIERAVGTLAR
jgi:cobalt-zinc-cadmium efflux system outer membrane protein